MVTMLGLIGVVICAMHDVELAFNFALSVALDLVFAGGYWLIIFLDLKFDFTAKFRDCKLP